MWLTHDEHDESLLRAPLGVLTFEDAAGNALELRVFDGPLGTYAVWVDREGRPLNVALAAKA